MASVLVILIILIFAGYHFQKGGVIKSFAMLIITIAATIITFAYFESLVNMLVTRVPDRFLYIVPWLHPISFVLLFALSFAILQLIVTQLFRQQINFEKNQEYIVRIIGGILIGFIFSGLLLTVLAMAPLPTKFPYQRFDKNRTEPNNPKKVLLNSDGFVTWLFSKISSGSFSAIKNKTSFAAVHPDYLDQLYLNRQGISDKTPIISFGNEIVLPAENAAWFAPEILKDSEANPIVPKTANNLVIVRVGIKRPSARISSNFTPSQLRLICKPKNSKKTFRGKGRNIFPLGYLKTSEIMQKTKLTEKIELAHEDLSDQLPQGSGKWIDFVFEVPGDLTPLVIEFRQNSIAQVPEPVGPDKALATTIFIPASECAQDFAEIESVGSAQIYGLSMTAQFKLLEELSLEIKSNDQFKQYQTDNSIEAPQYEDSKINYVRAELKTPTRREQPTTRYRSRSLTGLASMIKPFDEYKLLALKCNNPDVGSEIKGRQLPTLKELTGRIHRPAGVIACGILGSEFIYEIDFCSVTADQREDGLVLADDGTIERTFPETIWITEKTEKVLEFYVLYMVKPGPDVIITAVQPENSQAVGTFKDCQGFMVK